MSGIVELSFCFIVVGARGFTKGGLPLSATRRIDGGKGMVIGTLCLLFGILGLSFAYWAGSPAERQATRSFYSGIVVGILGTALVLGGSWAGRTRDGSQESEVTPPMM